MVNPSSEKCGMAGAMILGSLSFAVVSMLAFAVWAVGGRWLQARVSEIGMFAACMIVFLAASGLLMHPLVRGPCSLVRFYKIFIPAFATYTIAWSAVWFAFGFGWGEWLGSLMGSIVLAVMIGRGLGNFRPVIKVCIVIFVLHSAGYFLGGKLMQWQTMPAQGGLRGGHISILAKLCWGLAYGLGVGAGLGYAFFTFQDEPSETIKTPNPNDAPSAPGK